jgi:hypothetical protein
MAEKTEITLKFTVTPLAGGPKRTYTVRPLTGWQAMEIFDGQIKQILGALGTAVTGGDERAGHALKGVDYAATKAAVLALMDGAIVRSETTEPIFRDLCIVEFANAEIIGEYYGENPTEFYQALAQGINVNWPSVFSEARKRANLLWQKGKKAFRAFLESRGLPQTILSEDSPSKDDGG